MMDAQPLAAVIGDRAKRELLTELLGQCFVIAHATIVANRDGTDRVATRLEEAGELYGDDVENLLKSVNLRKPEIDLLEESTWPAI